MDLASGSSQDGVLTLDLSGCGLRKLERSATRNYQCLILDRNDLTRLENVETYGDLYKLSAAENKLVRMYCVSKFTNLRLLNLSKNTIVAIEGLRELVHLRLLNLSGNKLKAVDHLGSNVALEHLDLSNNCIATLSDISNLKQLQVLLLDYNSIRVLGSSSTSYLPKSIVTLSLTHNSITDLNEVCHLTKLSSLEQMSLNNNPCVSMTGNVIGFDHRPFVVNWCQSLKLLDGFVVTSKESLKAEWLYSMGKGRHFQPGEHVELVDYLSTVCPLTKADSAVSEEDAKLTRILGKRLQYQQQLMAEMSTVASVPNPQTEFRTTVTKAATAKKSNDGRQRNGPQRPCSWTAEPLVILSPPEAPSDVPELGAESDVELGATAGTMTSLHTETQYVPVPETMLSPDFRPIPDTMSSSTPTPPFSIFDLSATASSTDDLMTRSWDSTNLPRWLQRSCIPKSTGTPPARRTNESRSASVQNRRSYPSLTDSPILRRPTQVHRVQQSTRPSSLSPSGGRRASSSASSSKSTLTSKADSTSGSSSDNGGADSDVSLSKLSIVKEAAQLRQSAATKRRTPSKMSTSSKTQVKKSTRSTPTVNKSKPLPKDISQVSESQKLTRDKAACTIQTAWRGYWVRHHDVKAEKVRQDIRIQRAEDHVRLLQQQLSQTQTELDKEKRLRSLQMEAIRALWKEVQLIGQLSTTEDKQVESTTPEIGSCQPNITDKNYQNSEAEIVANKDNLMLQLITTCNNLQTQVQHLQTAVNMIATLVVESKSTCPTVEQQINGGSSCCAEIIAVEASRQCNGAGEDDSKLEETMPIVDCAINPPEENVTVGN